MKTILVPIDFSLMTRLVLKTAVSYAQAMNYQITLMHVVSTAAFRSPYPLQAEMRAQLIFDARKAAKEGLEKHAEAVRKQGVEAGIEVDEGDAVSSLLRVAREQSVDLIVLGSHGHRPLFDLLIGSTARGILQHAECPVLLVPSPMKLLPDQVVAHG